MSVPAAGAIPEAPAPADIPAEPIRPTTVVPAEPQTTRIPVAPPQHSPLERPTRPFQYAQTGTATAPPPPATDDAQAKGRGLVERMTDATRKLLPARTDTGPGELAPQTGRLPLLPGARTIGVAAYELGLSIDGHEVLANVSFTTRPGSLIAVVGPSAARNFALTALLAGTRPPSSGILTVDGHDVHAEPDAMRFRIGVVPRDNRVHPRLTVERALEYAAELRLPPNTTPENRARVVHQILDELELTPHRSTRVAKLPPEARRCASMAVELLARPSLLVVDEPGAGLDLAQANQVMGLLRRQADLGCVVVVASTSLAYLNLCDQVLLLTPAGRLAYAGPPSHVESALGTTDWSNIFRVDQRRPARRPPPVPGPAAGVGVPDPAVCFQAGSATTRTHLRPAVPAADPSATPITAGQPDLFAVPAAPAVRVGSVDAAGPRQ